MNRPTLARLPQADMSDQRRLWFLVRSTNSQRQPGFLYTLSRCGMCCSSSREGRRPLSSPKFGGLVLTEVNPDHDPDGTLARLLLDGLAVASPAAALKTPSS